MFNIENILNKLHYLSINVIFVIIVPAVIAFVVHKLASIILMLLTRKVMIDLNKKTLTINN